MALGSAFLDFTQVAGLLFVIASMLAMSLALTIPTIVVAISNVRLMTRALVANFVVVPALAYGAAQLISTSDQGLRTGLILVGAAGYLNWLLGHVEPNGADADTLARFSKIGVAGGAPFFSDVLPEEICDAIEAGVRAGDAEIDRKVTAIGTTVNGWQIVAGAFGNRSRMQNRWLVRAAAARFGLFGNPEEEAAYPFTFLGADGDELDGAHNDYDLRLPVPPVGAFWSVTMYRRGADHESHWLPAPDGPFDLILRLYIPGQSVLDGSWRPTAVEKAGRVTAPTDERVLASAAT